MAAWATENFGDTLLTRDGLRATSDLLSRKRFVAVHFGASWCPPCNAFLPVLMDFYANVKREVGADEFEVVFVSADTEQTHFEEYFNKTSFCALPFDTPPEVLANLRQVYGARGVPHIVVLDSSGAIKEANCRYTITSNKEHVEIALAKWA